MFADARLVTVAAMLTQLAGFGKTLLIAHLFGAAADLDGYYLALVIPSLVVGVIAGSLQAGFVTVYVKLLEANDNRPARQLVSQLTTLLLMFLGALCVISWLFAEPLMALLILSDNAVLLAATVSAFRVVVFILLLNCLADYFALVLNGHQRFSLAALSPLASVLLSTLILATWTDGGQNALTYGLLAGVCLQIVFLIGGLNRAGAGLALAWPRLGAHLREVLFLAVSMIAGILLVNINLAVDQVMATLLGEGAVSIIGYANRFNGLVVQILIVGVSTVLLPHLAQLLAAGRQQEIADIYRGLALPLSGAAVVAPIAIVLSSMPVLTNLMGHGALTDADIAQIASIWFWYTIGLLPMAWGIFLARYFQATRNLAFITKLAAISVAANIAFNLLLIGPLGLAGLAISTSLVYLVTGLLYHQQFARQTNFKLGKSASKLAAMIAAITIFLAWAFPKAIHEGDWTLTCSGVALAIIAAYTSWPKELIQQKTKYT